MIESFNLSGLQRPENNPISMVVVTRKNDSKTSLASLGDCLCSETLLVNRRLDAMTRSSVVKVNHT